MARNSTTWTKETVKPGPGAPRKPRVEIPDDVKWGEQAAELAERTIICLLAEKAPRIRFEAARYILDAVRGRPIAAERQPLESVVNGPFSQMSDEALERAMARAKEELS